MDKAVEKSVYKDAEDAVRNGETSFLVMTINKEEYRAEIKYSPEDGVFYGKLLDISSLVSFESEDFHQMKVGMSDAIEDYQRYKKDLSFWPFWIIYLAI